MKRKGDHRKKIGKKKRAGDHKRGGNEGGGEHIEGGDLRGPGGKIGGRERQKMQRDGDRRGPGGKKLENKNEEGGRPKRARRKKIRKQK